MLRASGVSRGSTRRNEKLVPLGETSPGLRRRLAALRPPLSWKNSRSRVYISLFQKYCSIRALMPEEDLPMFVEQNGTFWDKEKRFYQLPGVFGTRVHCCEGRNQHNSRAESRARNNLQQFATEKQRCYPGVMASMPATLPRWGKVGTFWGRPKMSPNAPTERFRQ